MVSTVLLFTLVVTRDLHGSGNNQSVSLGTTCSTTITLAPGEIPKISDSEFWDFGEIQNFWILVKFWDCSEIQDRHTHFVNIYIGINSF